MKLISLTAGLCILIHTSELINSQRSWLSGKVMDDLGLTTVEIIRKYGYPAETHKTVSEDGYILVLHRIPHGRNYTKPGVPLLLAQPLGSDSAMYLIHGEMSLGFFLADEGYDVWLVNFRGNHYTRTHKYLSSEDSKFWDFSFHEIGVYDLPAHIDYICNHTKSKDILYVGYSMGSTVLLVMASERPEYQNKIRGAVLLAPVASLKHSTAPIQFIFVPAMKAIQLVMKPRQFGGMFQDSAALQQALKFFCDLTLFDLKLCTYIGFGIGGIDVKGFDQRVDVNLVTHISATSIKVWEHFSQLFLTNKFRQFDYGTAKNLAIYKQSTPPEYHLKSTTIPISLFISLNDLFATPEDIFETFKDVPSVRSVYVVPQTSFTHVDFISGKDVDKILHPELSRQLKDFINIRNVD